MRIISFAINKTFIFMHLKLIYTIKTYKIQCTIIISRLLGFNFEVLKVKINTL